MTDLIPHTALGGTTPRQLRLRDLTMTERPDLALAWLARRQGAPLPAPFGLELPGPGGWHQGGDHAAFWTGPDQWMIEGPGRALEDFALAVAKAAPGASVSDQTDAWVAVDITATSGAAGIEALLPRLVNLDPRRLAPGSATRTGFEHLSVFIIRRAADHLTVLGMRSAAGSLWHGLERAARVQLALSA